MVAVVGQQEELDSGDVTIVGSDSLKIELRVFRWLKNLLFPVILPQGWKRKSE